MTVKTCCRENAFLPLVAVHARGPVLTYRSYRST